MFQVSLKQKSFDVARFYLFSAAKTQQTPVQSRRSPVAQLLCYRVR